MSNDLTILGIAGSLRRGSYNRALLDNVARVLPDGVVLQVFDGVGDLPLYTPDIDTEELRPDEVRTLRRLVEEAHGVLIATPEYNWSIPGVLKNALDWASRPGFASPFAGKPVGVMSASGGPAGGVRGQGALRHVLAGLAAHYFPNRGVAVGGAAGRFDADGRLGDDDLDFLRGYVEDFAVFVRRLAG